MNLILNECIEKVYSKEEGINIIQLGVMLIRGDSIILIGEIDT
jgi:U6 snRNA-associated Sm-like protein LSm8